MRGNALLWRWSIEESAGCGVTLPPPPADYASCHVIVNARSHNGTPAHLLSVMAMLGTSGLHTNVLLFGEDLTHGWFSWTLRSSWPNLFLRNSRLFVLDIRWQYGGYTVLRNLLSFCSMLRLE